MSSYQRVANLPPTLWRSARRPARYRGRAELPPCRSYGQGYWAVLRHSASLQLTAVKDRYRWREDGCRDRRVGVAELLGASPRGLSVYFVGDSLCRNLFVDFYETLGEKLIQAQGRGPAAIRFYEVYGYYDEVKPKACCGEADCIHRQEVRHHGQQGSGGGLRGLQAITPPTRT